VRRRSIEHAFRLLLGAAVLACPAVALAADAEAGKAAFKRCQVCHRLEAGGAASIGPNLHGVFGRKAGSVEGFAYSEAMKNSGVVWDDETLAKYLSDPKGFVPGNKMAFPGIKNEAELTNLLAYLKQASQ